MRKTHTLFLGNSQDSTAIHTPQEKLVDEQEMTESPIKKNILSTTGSKKLQVRYKDPVMESDSPRPTLSYNELIVEALHSSPDGMLSLQEIYDYIQDSYSFFKATTVVRFFSIYPSFFRHGRIRFDTIYQFKKSLKELLVQLPILERAVSGVWPRI